jgi:hypothetical protein
MPEITITLTDDEHEKLQLYAARERREPKEQGAVFISEALGCWHTSTSTKPASQVKVSRHKSIRINGTADAEQVARSYAQ